MGTAFDEADEDFLRFVVKGSAWNVSERASFNGSPDAHEKDC
jgi:hypothetical protein